MKVTLTYTTSDSIILTCRYDLEIEDHLQIFSNTLHALGAQEIDYTVAKWFPEFPVCPAPKRK